MRKESEMKRERRGHVAINLSTFQKGQKKMCYEVLRVLGTNGAPLSTDSLSLVFILQRSCFLELPETRRRTREEQEEQEGHQSSTSRRFCFPTLLEFSE
jgi:hypothetical protein